MNHEENTSTKKLHKVQGGCHGQVYKVIATSPFEAALKAYDFGPDCYPYEKYRDSPLLVHVYTEGSTAYQDLEVSLGELVREHRRRNS